MTMKIFLPNFLRWHPFLSLMLAGATATSALILYNYFQTSDVIQVPFTGVQHLGEDYRIDSFYVNKYGGDNVGGGGGGGSVVCCITLPRRWSRGLKADVRWEVHHLTKSTNSISRPKFEVEGIYKAQVPVEPYEIADHLWIHFFSNKRVRVVVSQFASDADQHPISLDGARATDKATSGKVVEALFSPEEIIALEHASASNRKKYGDWR